jgi:Uma2 family endonuclease
MNIQTETTLEELRRDICTIEPGQVVLRHKVHQDTFQQILSDLEGRSGIRLLYLEGTLELMSPKSRHALVMGTLDEAVSTIRRVMKIKVLRLPENQLKKPAGAGAIPDCCFYMQSYERVRGKEDIDLTIDPPPDLVIEVDIAHSSVASDPIHASMRVPEIWRYTGAEIQIRKLEGGSYTASEASVAFPWLPRTRLTTIVEESKTIGQTEADERFEKWVRRQKRKLDQSA